jgi:hypothetical protein
MRSPRPLPLLLLYPSTTRRCGTRRGPAPPPCTANCIAACSLQPLLRLLLGLGAQVLTLYKAHVDPSFEWTNFSLEEQSKVITGAASERGHHRCCTLQYP